MVVVSAAVSWSCREVSLYIFALGSRPRCGLGSENWARALTSASRHLFWLLLDCDLQALTIACAGVSRGLGATLGELVDGEFGGRSGGMIGREQRTAAISG